MEDKKLILIPESRPLYAMQRRLMIGTGPILKPIPVPISAIGELLRQSGNEKVTIYEVVKKGNRYSKEVQLTLDNYTLPYDEILTGPPARPQVEQAPLPMNSETVAPEVSAFVDNSVPAENEEVPGDEIVELTPETAPDELRVLDNPYAGMTRRQRKAAMRAARRDEQAAQSTESHIDE